MATRPLRILLVEDNPADTEVVREAIGDLPQSDAASEILVVENGSKAMACLRGRGDFEGAFKPDLVFMDINLPGKNGIEILRDIKADPELRSVPVIMLTTSNRREDIFSAYQAGAASYVVKPLKFHHLRETVRGLINYWTTVSRLPPDPPAPRTGRPENSQSGLTLIELLSVTLILGVISSIAISQIGQVVSRARKSAMITYMASDFRAAMWNYYIDHGYYPPGTGATDPTLVLKAEDYVTRTFTEKTTALNLTISALYFSGPQISVLPGALKVKGYWYAWCILPPASVGIKLPCVKLTESTLEESKLLLTP